MEFWWSQSDTGNGIIELAKNSDAGEYYGPYMDIGRDSMGIAESVDANETTYETADSIGLTEGEWYLVRLDLGDPIAVEAVDETGAEIYSASIPRNSDVVLGRGINISVNAQGSGTNYVDSIRKVA